MKFTMGEEMKDETLRNRIIYVLNKYPETRNDDNVLVLRLLINLGFAWRKENKIIIDLLNFQEFPSFESITRVRRELQNTEKLYLPNEKVKEQRQKTEVKYKEKYHINKLSVDTFPNSQLS